MELKFDYFFVQYDSHSQIRCKINQYNQEYLISNSCYCLWKYVILRQLKSGSFGLMFILVEVNVKLKIKEMMSSLGGY